MHLKNYLCFFVFSKSSTINMILLRQFFSIKNYRLESHPVLGCVWCWCPVGPGDALIVQRVYLQHLKPSTLHTVFGNQKQGGHPKLPVERTVCRPIILNGPSSQLPKLPLGAFCLLQHSTTVQNVGQMQFVGGKHEFGLKCSFFASGSSFYFNHYTAEHIAIWHPPASLCECLEDTSMYRKIKHTWSPRELTIPPEKQTVYNQSKYSAMIIVAEEQKCIFFSLHFHLPVARMKARITIGERYSFSRIMHRG